MKWTIFGRVMRLLNFKTICGVDWYSVSFIKCFTAQPCWVVSTDVFIDVAKRATRDVLHTFLLSSALISLVHLFLTSVCTFFLIKYLVTI